MEIAITIVTTTRTDGSFNSESERYNRSFRSDLRERILSAQFIEGVHIEARRVLPFVDIYGKTAKRIVERRR